MCAPPGPPLAKNHGRRDAAIARGSRNGQDRPREVEMIERRRIPGLAAVRERRGGDSVDAPTPELASMSSGHSVGKSATSQSFRVVPTAYPKPRKSRAEAIRLALPSVSAPLAELMSEVLAMDEAPRKLPGPVSRSRVTKVSRSRTLLGQFSLGQVLVGVAGRPPRS